MKIDEKVFGKVFKKNIPFENAKHERWKHNYIRDISRHVLIKYLAEIDKPICIKKLKKNTMIIRGERD